MTPSTRRRATEWLAADPDPETGAELRALLAGDPVDLERRFEGRLAFGTAGMRGRMGSGPLRMNRVLVRMVAAALAERVLQEREERPHVMVGYDARHKSGLFADDTARVLAARRVPVTVLPGPVPTPVLAFAVKHLDASAGVMVTASHNPRTDNGYKVYWRGGRQLAAPTDAEISRIIDRTAPPVPGDLASGDDPLVAAAGDDLIEAYLEAVAGLLAPQGSRSVRIAYTPLHGVGAATFLRALSHAGFDPPAVVAGQAEPDPDFPTAPFPNPEETGVLDPLMALAADTGADVALAHDPDADRLAVAVPAGGRWRMLTGDETGCLLAEYLLGRDEGRRDGRHRLLVNTVVSSRLLRRIAAHHDAEWAETLTGFKWIMQAHSQRASSHDLVLGYEEALGYAVGEAVSDKDGIGTALVMAELVAELKARGQALSDLLDDLHRRHGVHASGQRSIRFESTPGGEQPMKRAMAALREAPPAGLAGAAVTAVHDLAAGSGDLPPADAVVLEVSGREARVIVRPSGTEPKMKVYAEAVVAPPTGGGDVPWLGPARVEARTRMAAVLDAAVGHVADPERHESVRAASADSRTGDLPARTQTADRAKPSRADDLRLIVRCIDLTTLEGDDTPGRIRALCSQALRPDPADPTVGPVAAVCVYPSLAGLAAELLAGTPVAVASVAGAFPSGLSPLEVKVAEVSAAVADGATEIDTVLNRAAFLSGRHDLAAAELRALRKAAGSAHFKVILEVCELGSAAAVVEATRLAIDAGADMVKTSTGKGAAGASPAAVAAMAEAVAEHCAAGGRPVGIKVAGGVRTAADALEYLEIVRDVLGDGWLVPERLRFGASSLLGNVVAELVAC
ncbi:MAG: deoxyribose-phosphate aldolase [Acidimicrobiaceae bacterium]|nr:deoxyribose-phosphate aldolase [Acidimicrobiaceae bacterium]MXY11087.1 deoxyribose-phosphate aldolase [Acidimicrobiaceae bacterium]MYF34875.1 deoxyribose-phosphate aldolase [Acidimicrobiaceae bacterium]MYG78333.1 deoxyribose-phosphate aldolase [Acidimicrobiaceae bacterium]MYJ83242.1 deoxyribose-phosphate aldolase [Acidimicrobiaceae bacterium]